MQHLMYIYLSTIFTPRVGHLKIKPSQKSNALHVSASPFPQEAGKGALKGSLGGGVPEALKP